MNNTLRDLHRPAKFAVVGLANTAVDIGVFGCLTVLFGWSPVIANVVSYSAGHMNSFLLNRHWTFKSRGTGPASRASGWRQFTRFTAVNLAAMALNTSVVWLLGATIGALPAKFAATVVSFAWGYALSRRWAFS